MSDFAKLSASLKDVHVLNSPEDYQEWYRTLMDHLILGGLGNVTYKPQERPAKFKEFKAANETPTRQIHRLRSDNGGEYLQKGLAAFRAEHGIRWEPSTSNHQMQNGTAERLQQTLHKRAFAILMSGDFDNRWWAEALATANYLRMRSPHARLKMTPYEAWFHAKPILRHIRTVGSNGWYKLLGTTKDPKLTPRSAHARLIGFEGNKIYRLIDDRNRLVRSTQVIFQERIPK